MNKTTQAGLQSWSIADRVACIYIVAWLAFYGLYILKHSHFTNDDLDCLIALHKSPSVFAYLMAPVNDHFVPLCRFMIWATYRMAPMHFGLVVLIMFTFHAGTIRYLWLTLRLTASDRIARMIACLYASSLLPIFGMIWWANAMCRVPYVFFAAGAVYHYLHWQRGGRRRHLLACVTAFVVAFGFYEKAVLIPLFMAGAAWLAFPVKGAGARWRTIKIPAFFLVFSCVYVLVYMHYKVAQLNLDPATALRAEIMYPVSLLAALLGSFSYVRTLPMTDPVTVSGWLMAGSAWLFMLARGLWRAPLAWIYMLAIPAIALLDFLPIAVSNRTLFAGPSLIYYYRYHFDSIYMVSLAAGLWWREVAAKKPNPVSPHAITWTPFLLTIYGAVNFLALIRAANHSDEFVFMRYSYQYMHHLDKSLKQVPVGATFTDSPVPGYLSVFKFIEHSRDIVLLYKPNAHFDTAHSGVFRVGIDGNVQRL